MHCFFFSSRRRHTRYWRDWSSDVCSSDLFPELFLPTAIGKDYSGKKLLTSAPSGRGFQFSLFGLAAFTASAVEGFEVNLLGLSFGINPFDPSLKLPLVGRVGPPRALASKVA